MVHLKGKKKSGLTKKLIKSNQIKSHNLINDLNFKVNSFNRLIMLQKQGFCAVLSNVRPVYKLYFKQHIMKLFMTLNTIQMSHVITDSVCIQ